MRYFAQRVAGGGFKRVFRSTSYVSAPTGGPGGRFADQDLAWEGTVVGMGIRTIDNTRTCIDPGRGRRSTAPRDSQASLRRISRRDGEELMVDALEFPVREEHCYQRMYALQIEEFTNAIREDRQAAPGEWWCSETRCKEWESPSTAWPLRECEVREQVSAGYFINN